MVRGTTAVGKPKADTPELSKASVYCTSPAAWIFAPKDCEVFAIPATCVVSTFKVKVYEPPADTWKPFWAVPNVHVAVHGELVVVATPVASPAVTTLLPFWSISERLFMSAWTFELVADIRLPLKVTFKLSNATGPALFAETVIVPIVSGLLLLCELPPAAATVTESTLRKTVWALPDAETEPMFVVLLDVAPRAVIADDVAIEKVWIELSVAPFEAYVAASPFRVSEMEFACGTITGFPKWNE